jgi:two-component system response regulator QseB
VSDDSVGRVAPIRVLVIEDDPRIAGMLAKGLSGRSYEVHCVSNGMAALERLEAGGIDVQLLDLGLPDIDGLEVLRRQRAAGITVPVVVVTARSDPRDRAAALELGAHEYLLKPFAWASVWSAIGRCVAEGDQPGQAGSNRTT